MVVKWRYLVLLAVPLVLGMTEAPRLKKHTIRGVAQGTDYMVIYYATDSLVRRTEIDDILAAVDSSMSLYKPYSLINKINSGGRGVFFIDEHFERVVRRSLDIYRNSNGLFDVTVAPLVELWGFGVQQATHVPDSAAVELARDCVGMDDIRISDRSIEKKKDCTRLDFNGIAQGYTVDLLADMLEKSGVKSYVVELGGELRVQGPKPDGSAIRVGIERPIKEAGASLIMNAVIEVNHGAITTAGSYRRFATDGDRVITHHIDPRTGYPFQSGIVSATVYAADAMTADGYDNVVMAMPADAAIAFANNLDEIEVYLIYKDQNGTIRDTMSSGFGKLINNN